MITVDEQIEETHVHATRRASRRPPEAVLCLSDRIRKLQRTEPTAVGDLRTSVLSELALIELQLERLSLNTWRDNTSQRQTVANVAALTEQVDRLAIYWPHQIASIEESVS